MNASAPDTSSTGPKAIQHRTATCLLKRCRNRFVRAAQVVATLCMCLMPLPASRAAWSDADVDGFIDTWTNPVTGIAYTLAELDALGLDTDGDNAQNYEELAYGSDPQDFDSDDDGLDDGVEIHQAIQSSGKAYSLTNWDSNGDGVSDHDDFYGYFGVTYPSGILPSFTGATYSDYDGDGTKNPFDAYPTDPMNNDADQDGINDNIDPVLNDSSNTSTANGQAWYSNALGDNDNDLILNFYDSLPNDDSNGNIDSDGDTILNYQDPYPLSHENYSPTNSIYWYGAVLGDADGDGVLNHADAWPYSAYNGNSDVDNDGIDNDLDPAPNDANNYSSANNTSWYGYALEDQDDDGSSNFNDPYPADTYNNLPDFDGDSVPNGDDPFPKDSTNFSALNQSTWYGSMFLDGDDDGIANWQDEFPTDPYNNNPDFDGDGILNGTDPYPTDLSNFSSVNGISWGTNVSGDADGDTTPNWSDSTPYGVPDTDADDDGIDDDADPYDNDATNYSSTNNTTWGSNVLGNNDGDSLLNWEDAWPDDSWNGNNPDRDGDGIPNETDPAPDDSNNWSNYNSTSWYSIALGDADVDGTANFWDYQPYFNPDNTDGDAYLNSNDPAPTDSINYSYINTVTWNNNALGDEDSDGTQNFYDSTPYGTPPPVDFDKDGLNVDEETSYGTSDNDVDSDDDLLTDGEEVEVFGTDPANAHDLSQQMFDTSLYTDWQLVDLTDTDGDYIPDRIETYYNLNLNSPADALLDRDNNGINNRVQYQMGIALDADLERYDADGDGMSDVFEDYYLLAKSNFADAVADPDNDGVVNHEEMVLLLSPNVADTQSIGGLGDLQVLMLAVRYPDSSTPSGEDSSPANGIPDWADAALATPSVPDFYHFTRATTGDLDGDGLPDVYEHTYGRWKFQSNGLLLRRADAADDADSDGYTNLFEYQVGSSPLAGDTDNDSVNDAWELSHFGTLNRDTRLDTDSDGFSDAEEYAAGTDPTNWRSRPGGAAGGAVSLAVYTPVVR